MSSLFIDSDTETTKIENITSACQDAETTKIENITSACRPAALRWPNWRSDLALQWRYDGATNWCYDSAFRLIGPNTQQEP